jgi:tetratricopeptide (TPR) repeat protein
METLSHSNYNSTAYVIKAQSEIEQGDYYNAIRDCDKAISLKPGFDSNSYYYRGVAELKIGNKDKACDDFYQAKKITGDHSYYKLNEAIRKNCQ